VSLAHVLEEDGDRAVRGIEAGIDPATEDGALVLVLRGRIGANRVQRGIRDGSLESRKHVGGGTSDEVFATVPEHLRGAPIHASKAPRLVEGGEAVLDALQDRRIALEQADLRPMQSCTRISRTASSWPGLASTIDIMTRRCSGTASDSGRPGVTGYRR
jgi:hypothetical protein